MKSKKLNEFIFVAFLILVLQPSISALSASVHIPEKYNEVLPGERIYFEVEIKYPENTMRKDLRINYEISKDGEIIMEAKVLKAIETQTSFIDYVILPESAEKGLYDLIIKIGDYEELDEEIKTSFKIEGKYNETKLYFFIIIGLIFVFGVIISWEVYKIKKR